MKKSTIWKSLATIAIMLVAGNTLFAQEVAMPGGLFQHGNNSSNAPVASENTDSITVGSVLQYWAQPDAAFVGATSTFTWGISGLGAVGATTTNLATITYGATTGSGTITVQEIAPTTSCPGSTTTIGFEVVAAPTANFGADPAAQCFVAAPGQLSFGLPITVTTPIAGASSASTVRVRYTVYDPSNNPIAGLTNIDVELQAGAVRTITVQLPAGAVAGTYYALISSITDRISRKPATDIEGTYTAGNNRIDMVVYPLPTTGPIFHVPNM